MPLRPSLRVPFALINLGLGLVPSLAFFAWVERNASLPYVGLQLGWPWLELQSRPLPFLAAWNCGLFLAFGALHSGLAQRPVQRALARLFPPQATRTLYVAATGLSLTALMGLWQNTGVVLWLLALPQMAVNALSLALFWGLMACLGLVMSPRQLLEFVGLSQLYGAPPAQAGTLRTTGIYARVRHPIYAFTSLAFLATPFMTLDRALVCVSMAAYLAAGIPLEERKLRAAYGQEYERYRQKVPAVLPSLRLRSGS